MKALFFTVRMILCMILGVAFQVGMPFVGIIGGMALGMFAAGYMTNSPTGECGEWISVPVSIGACIGCILGFGLGIVGGSVLTALVFGLSMPEG